MSEQIIKLSDNAVNRIKEIMSKAENSTIGVRVGVESGGCAGMSYVMEYAKDVKPNEEIIEEKVVKEVKISDDLRINSTSIVSFFTKSIMTDLRLYGGQDILYGKLKLFLTYRRFNEIIIYSTFFYNNKKFILN